MNRDDIIRMAREAGLVRWLPNSTYTDGCWWIEAHEPDESLEQFAALVAAAERERNTKEFPVQFGSVKAWEDWCKSIRDNEREACAKVCDEFAKESDWPTADNCAAVIRARGQA
jgi:hypothetical protein